MFPLEQGALQLNVHGFENENSIQNEDYDGVDLVLRNIEWCMLWEIIGPMKDMSLLQAQL